jgi:signal transduction histidine kinase
VHPLLVSDSTAAPRRDPRERPPLVRRTDDRLLAGVGSGIATHLDVPVVGVRVALALLVGSGIGVFAYAALWLLLPVDPDAGAATEASGNPQARATRARRAWQLLAYLVVGSLAGGILGAFGRPFGGGVVGPLAIAAIGALLIWRRAPDDQRSKWSEGARLAGQRYGAPLLRRSSLWFPLVGVVLVVAGVAAFLAAHDALAQARAGALAILATLAGVCLVAGPWLLRLIRDLGTERRARIREQERAAVAAHVHDSVLQTLALVRARADDPTAVRRLARRQERDLRAWLYGPGLDHQDRPATLGEELRTMCADVEDDTGVQVEVVTVGAAMGEPEVVDPRVQALVAAAREAVLNAAKSSGAGEVALYAEAEPAQFGVWVRDRGRGFDPEAIGSDRHGIRDSILGRMESVGGRSRIRSAPGQGTEVELLLPRVAADDGSGAAPSPRKAAP